MVGSDAVAHLGAFEVSEQIGRGSYGTVWAGRHRRTGLPVAIKLLPPAVGQQAIEREIRSVAGLDHRNIVRLLDVGVLDAAAAGALRQAEGSAHLVMEYADRGTVLALCGRSRWPRVRRVLLAMLEGLAHAHARGVVHHDIKPSNVLLRGPDLDVLLADFGLARSVGERSDGLLRGTPGYMSPELGDHPGGIRADLYAVGCVAVALVSGHPPYAGSTPLETIEAHRQRPIPALEAVCPVPAGFEEWVRWLLQKERTQRPESAAHAAWHLAVLARDVGGAGPLKPPEAVSDALTFTFGPELPADRTPVPRDGSPVEMWALPALPAVWAQPGRPPSPEVAEAGVGLLPFRRPALVARHQERDRLWALLQGVACTPMPVLSVLQGPRGVGVTALAEWFCERASETGAVAVVQVHRGALRPALRRLLGCVGQEGPADRRWVAGQVSAWTGEASADLSKTLLKALEGINPLFGFFELMQVMANRGPLLIHLADPDDLDMANRLVLALTGPVLVLASHTPELPGCPDTPLVSLSADVLATLLQEHVCLAADTAWRLIESVHGRPAAALEQVRDWAQTGALVAGPGGYVVAWTEQPGSIWTERAERLCQGTDGRVFEIAALLGDVVDAQRWSRACAAAGVTLSPALRRRLDLGRWTRPVPAGWAFTRGALRQALLERMRAEDREQALSCACAAAYAGAEGPELLPLAGHLLRAGQVEPAVVACRTLADFAFSLAGDAYKKPAAELYGRIGPLVGSTSPDDLRRWLRLLRSTDPAACWSLSELFLSRYARDGETLGMVRIQRAALRVRQGRAADALKELDAIQASSTLSLEMQIGACAIQANAWSQLQQHDNAVRTAERGLALQAQPGALATLQQCRAVALVRGGRLEEAEQAVGALTTDGLSGLRTRALQAELRTLRGDQVGALAAYERLVEHAAALGAMTYEWLARANVGLLRVQLGLPDALPLLERSHRAMQLLGRQDINGVVLAARVAILVEADHVVWRKAVEELEAAAERDVDPEMLDFVRLAVVRAREAGRGPRVERLQRIAEHIHSKLPVL
jgi:hypothetical protein